MKGHTLGTSVMMKLGAYQFSISTAAYQELTRRTEWRWPTQDLYGVLPGVQFTGPGGDTITLSGVIYAEYRGGLGQLDAMRALGASGAPQLLVTGSGTMMGRWVIESVEEKQSTFAAAGAPRKQEFTLQLRKAKDQPAQLVQSPPAAVAKAAAPSAPATGVKASDALAAPKSAVASFAEKASSAVGSAVKSATAAVQAVQAKAAEIGSAVAPVVATAQRAVQTANALRAAAENMKGSLQNLNSLGGIQSAIYGVQGAASAVANAGAFASGAAKQLGINIDLPAADPALVKTVKDCQAACGRLATTATGIYSEAETLAKSVSSMVRP